jgi:citronellol/citronellal dehydrogenase
VDRFSGRVAIVTGASRGIGQAIAWRLAAEGAGVVLIGRDAGRRNTELAGTLEETAQRIREYGGRSLTIMIDLGDPATNKDEIVEKAEVYFGKKPDILVNNAAAPREFGGDDPPIPFAETTHEFFMRAVEINVWAAWELAKHVVPGMREQGAGWILMISSQQAAPRPSPVDGGTRFVQGGACLYGGTKAFLDRITSGAAVELYDDNIAVNSLAPTGAVRTPLSETVVRGLDSTAWEPMEAFVEAAVTLCCGDPKKLTSRIVHSLPFLAETSQPVYTLDGRNLFEGWQPNVEDPRKNMVSYLSGH